MEARTETYRCFQNVVPNFKLYLILRVYGTLILPYTQVKYKNSSYPANYRI